MADAPVAVSIWRSQAGDDFLGSGVLLDRQHVLTAGHLADGGTLLFIGLIDGVAERRRANLLARHEKHDVALLKMEAQTPNAVAPPELLAEYVDLARQPIVLHVISPLNKSRAALDIYQAATYSDADGEYELTPENARGHSGGVVAWRGLIAGVLFARAINDPLCRAVSMHRLAQWIKDKLPGVVLKNAPAAAVVAQVAIDSARRGVAPPATAAAVTPPAPAAAATAPQQAAAPAPANWQPDAGSAPADTSGWNLDLLLPFARHLGAQPGDIDAYFNAVGGSTQSQVEVVTGAQGAGKSAWLLMLYEAATRRKNAGLITLRPRFVDLERELDRLQSHGNPIQARQELQQAFTKLLDEERANFFVVDGCTRDNPLLSIVLQHLALFLPTSSLLIAVDDAFEPRLLELMAQAGLPAPTATHRLRAPDSADPQAQQFCSDFIDAYREMVAMTRPPRETGDAVALLDRVRQLGFEVLDTHLVAIVYQTLNDSDYDKFRNKTDFLERYCAEKLRSSVEGKRTQREAALEADLALAAQIAFDQFNQRYEALARPAGSWDPDRNRRVQALVREHQNVRDYLAARHLATLLQKAAKDDDAKAKIRARDFLTIDVPETVSAHVKRLLNRDEARDRAFRTIEATHREVAIPTAQFMYYLLGRLEGANTNAKARAFLQGRKKELLADVAQAADGEERIQKLAMLRTVFVSLIYLVEDKAMAQYIAHMIELPEAASVNRGFHRIYYGDTTPGVGAGAHRYLDDDAHKPWDRTCDALVDRLRRQLLPDADGDVSFDLRVFTLISFLRSRASEGVRFADAEPLYALLQECVPALALDELRHFVRSFLIDVKRASFSQWDFIHDLYRLKATPRQGWLDRGIGAPAPQSAETVAEHQHLCCLLAWFLLPDARPGDAYDKTTVLQMLLVHDIAEAYIGDQVTHNMTPDALAQYRREESAAMHYLRARETHGQLHGAALAFDRWREFEGEGATLSAKYAKDFDRLENLVQLYVYRDKMTADVFEQFRAGLVERLNTDLVKGLASSLATWHGARAQGPVASDDVAWWRARLSE